MIIGLFGLFDSFWIAMIILGIASIVMIITVFLRDRASRKRVEEMAKEMDKPKTLGISVGENVDTEERIL